MLAASGGRIRFTQGGRTWVANQIEGQFPDYERIIPSAFACTITAPTEDLKRLASLGRRFDLLKDDRGNGSSVARLAISDRVMAVVAKGAYDDQEALGELAVEQTGEPIKVGLNARYLYEALSAIGNGRTTIAFAGPSSPAVIRPAGDPNGHRQVVMPMFIKDQA